MAMVNMQMSAEEAKEYTQPVAADAPRYPYGLCIDLTDDALTRLGIKSLPAVGTVMMLTARVEVTSASSYQTQGAEAEQRVSLQITDMDLQGSQSRQQLANQLYSSGA